MPADDAYEAAVDRLMAQSDQHDAWYDYLNDWYAAEHSAAALEQVLQTMFDAAEAAAQTARAVAFEEADWVAT